MKSTSRVSRQRLFQSIFSRQNVKFEPGKFRYRRTHRKRQRVPR